MTLRSVLTLRWPRPLLRARALSISPYDQFARSGPGYHADVENQRARIVLAPRGSFPPQDTLTLSGAGEVLKVAVFNYFSSNPLEHWSEVDGVRTYCEVCHPGSFIDLDDLYDDEGKDYES